MPSLVFARHRRKLLAVVALLLRAILIATALGAAGCSDSKQDDPYKNFSPEGRALMETKNLTTEQKQKLKLVEIDYAKAPPEMRAIAHKIFLGQTPTQQELKALGGNIDKSFPTRKPNGLYRHGRTLLFTAVENHNLAAVDALLAAGASPYVSIDPGNESAQVRAWNFIYLVLQEEGEQLPNEERFDKTYANQLLELYLKNGGDANYRWPDGDTLLDATFGMNLDGFKILLKAGADPWVHDRNHDPLPVQLVLSGGYNAPRFIHYLAEQGYYDNIPGAYLQEMMNAVTRKLDSGIRSDPNEMGKYYVQFAQYADAIKLVLNRAHYSLPKDSELYRLLYVDDHLYRKPTRGD
ncbi:hypothetical protein GCM10011491_10570 [Brucella endophytica]|uniref:Ankyrin repeat domain-containing protein n=1 Tax=Brucella endophytica TaxID=1963359 RepID=A0A916WB94_9HYPH|nr:ankyrin repeat domain-containing protein [Brucella endophytica]GGA84870.1 hypothetical protein GCM10011491_10570 [Brucella endophytica]